MRVNYFKGILILSIIILGSMVAPAFGANPRTNNIVINKMLEDAFNSAISSLPDDASEPMKKIIAYVQERTKCSNWEAGQIVTLMSANSEQAEGFDYYVRYMMGDTTAEEDNADYYIAIREEWDQFLDEYAKMTPEQRAEALMSSATNEDVERILKESSSEEIDFILSTTEPYLDKIENLSNELSSKSTAWMIGHVEKTSEYGKGIDKAVQEYNEAVVRADEGWHMRSNNNLNNINFVSNPYDEALAYGNIIEVMRALNSVGHVHNFSLLGREDALPNGDIVQYVIDSSISSSPMYKYLVIKDNKSVDNKVKVDSVDLSAVNLNGDVITENKDDIEHDVKKVTFDDWSDTKWVDKDDIRLWGAYIARANPDETLTNVRDLFAIYQLTDSTGLNERVKDILPRPDPTLHGRAITEIVSGSLMFIASAAGLIKGVGLLATPAALIGVALIVLAVLGIIAAITLIVVGSEDIRSYIKSKKTHNTQNNSILSDIKKFNSFPFIDAINA